MMFRSVLTALVLGLSGAVLANPVSRLQQQQSQPRQQAGSIKLVQGEDLFTFDYTTDAPNWWNWIGIYYASGGGPDDGQKGQPSLVWDYAPDASGRLRVPVGELLPGRYKAYLLAQDGYASLAEPLEVIVPRPNVAVSFYPSDVVTLRAARQGSPYEADISGMLAGGGADLSFAVAGSERGSWVSVSSEGVLSGTPDSTNSPATVTIQATGTDGSTAQLTVSIPVRSSSDDTKLVERLRVLTYNLWHGGTQVNDYHAKQVRFLSEIDVDVVGLQESTGGHALRLANALGWHAIQGESVAIISRWPFGESHGNPITQGQGVRIAIDGDRQQVDFWNVHLGYTPYGPYDFCFDNMAVDTVLQREAESGRTGQIEDTVAAMKASLDAADDVPVLLTGDFNAPSHLDWTEAAKDAHCGYSDVPWPSSKRPIDAGLTDSFREAHPDPVEEPGITWSPIFLTNEGRNEPMDRIDFIYYKGSSLQVVSSESQLRGDPKPEPDHADNEWTSDHRAMLTEFALS